MKVKELIENIDTNASSIKEDIKTVEDFIDGVSVFLTKYSTKKVEKIIDEESYIAIKHILSDYKKLKEEFKAVDSECSRLERKETDMERENEELKATLRDTQNSWFEDTKKIEKLKAQNKELETQYLLQKDLINSNEYISKKRIKDKIEEISKTKGDLATYIAVSERIRVLQELLEESEEKDGEGKKSTNTSRNTRA